MLELPPTADLAWLFLAALSAGLARGFSGFGAALIFVPLASAVVGPQVAVPLLLVVDGVMSAGMIPAAARQAQRSEVMVMAIGAVFGVPAGVWLLANLEPSTIRWSIVLVVVILLGLLMSGRRYSGRPGTPLTVLVGLVSGVFSGAAQIGGPPVVAYWLGGDTPLPLIRANIVAYFVISTVLAAVGYIWGGLITSGVLLLAAVNAPLYGLGVWAGSRMFALASERTFRRISYAMIGAAALAGMPVLDVILRGN